MESLKQKNTTFRFKQFSIEQDNCTMKVGTDGVLLGAWLATNSVEKALDIGTGTGVIAIMIGQKVPDAQIKAIEIDAAAAEQAKQNALASPWKDQIEVIHQSIQDFQKETREKYDLIVSNPPFFSGGTFSSSQDKNNVRHTIKLPHGDLLSAVRNLLKEDGKFCVILPYIEGLRFQELAQTYNLYCNRITEVYPTKSKPVERLLMQFEQTKKKLLQDQLTIQEGGRNEWTEEYIKLTKDFYLKM